MLGIHNYITVTVINSLKPNNTNNFDTTSTIHITALNSIKNTTGNQHSKTAIQKQAYNIESAPTIRSTYGLTGTNLTTHTPYLNGKQTTLDQQLKAKSDIVLIKNDLNVTAALLAAAQHRIFKN